MSGGGKGGSQSTSVTIPAWLEEAAQRNIGRAENLAQIGYTPYYGPEVAAMTPMQLAAMQGTNQAAGAFGLGQVDPTAGMPQSQTFAGGVQGYGSGGLYDEALATLQQRAPGQFAALNSPFLNPVTGAPPLAPFGAASMSPAAQPMAGQPMMQSTDGGGAMWSDGMTPAQISAAQANRTFGNAPTGFNYQDTYDQQMAQYTNNPGMAMGGGNNVNQAMSNAGSGSSGMGGGK